MNTLHHKSDAFYKNNKGSSAQQKIQNLFYVQIVDKMNQHFTEVDSMDKQTSIKRASCDGVI